MNSITLTILIVLLAIAGGNILWKIIVYYAMKGLKDDPYN